MKLSRKIISTMLIMSILITCFAIAPSATENEKLNFAVVSDVHAKEKDAKISNRYPESELYFHAENTGNLYCEAIGILTTFLNQVAEKGLDFVIIPGDLTNNGRAEQHEYFADVLEKFENKTGIQVYVTPGNHDYYNSTPNDFKEYYAHFGYDEAISADSETASYVVDLPNDTRLISIDSNKPGDDGDNFDDRLISWVEKQAVDAKNDGKKVIAMMHHALLDPVPFGSIIMRNFVIRKYKEVSEKFTQWGIHYIFTGHEHGNNITSYKGSNGEVVYDVLTTALTSYPLEYRTISLDENKMEIKCNPITECNFDFVGEGYTDAQLELMKNDYTEYSYGYFKFSIQKKLTKFIDPNYIKDKLKTDNSIICEAIDAVMPIIDEALNMPLYSDETDATSVESFAQKSGVAMPESEYASLIDLIATIVAKVYYGEENMPFDTAPEGKVLIVGLNTMLKYVVEKVGNETAEIAVNAVADMIGLEKADEVKILDLFRKTVSADTYETVYSVLGPVLEIFLVDDDIPDRNATLVVSSQSNGFLTTVTTIFETIIKLMKYVINIVLSVIKI